MRCDLAVPRMCEMMSSRRMVVRSNQQCQLALHSNRLPRHVDHRPSSDCPRVECSYWLLDEVSRVFYDWRLVPNSDDTTGYEWLRYAWLLCNSVRAAVHFTRQAPICTQQTGRWVNKLEAKPQCCRVVSTLEVSCQVYNIFFIFHTHRPMCRPN